MFYITIEDLVYVYYFISYTIGTLKVVTLPLELIFSNTINETLLNFNKRT